MQVGKYGTYVLYMLHTCSVLTLLLYAFLVMLPNAVNHNQMKYILS